MFCPNAVVWGDVATWATAVFTLAATIGAAIAARAAWRVLELERARDDRAELDRRRAQAEQVSGWLDAKALPARSALTVFDQVGVRVINSSMQPVFGVHALIHLPDGQDVPCGSKAVLPPNETTSISIKSAQDRVLSYLDGDAGERLRSNWPQSLEDMPVVLEFTDAGGRWWRRNFDGQIDEMTVWYGSIVIK